MISVIFKKPVKIYFSKAAKIQSKSTIFHPDIMFACSWQKHNI